MREEGVHFYCNVVFAQNEKKTRDLGYSFKLYAGVKLNAAQELGQKVSPVT